MTTETKIDVLADNNIVLQYHYVTNLIPVSDIRPAWMFSRKWKVYLEFDRPEENFDFEYTEGSGYCLTNKKWTRVHRKYPHLTKDESIRIECQYGPNHLMGKRQTISYLTSSHYVDFLKDNGLSDYYESHPSADEMMAAVIRDVALVEQCRSFEEYCRETGDDSDSRKALEIYEECVKRHGHLVRALGYGKVAGLIDWVNSQDDI
jgi:hypothetical protein